MRASRENRRCIIAMLVISSEKKAHGRPSCTAIFASILIVRAVLPTDGRAPMTINSEGCRPPRRLSNPLNPVGTACESSLLVARCSIAVKVSTATSRTNCGLLLMAALDILNSSVSTLSMVSRHAMVVS